MLNGTIMRDIQKGTVTALDERLENYYFMRGVAVLPLPGIQVWYLKKDSEGKYCEVEFAKFIALGRDCVVLSHDVDAEHLIKECEEHFGCRSHVFVLPVGDVFEKATDAEAELQKRREHYGD